MVKKCPSCGYNNRDDAAFCSSCGASLAGAAAPALKPVPSVRVVTPVTSGSPIRVPAPGQCFYHPNLPAIYVCNRCGRSICRDDSKAYMDLVLCPQCYQGVVPMMAAPQPPGSSLRTTPRPCLRTTPRTRIPTADASSTSSFIHGTVCTSLCPTRSPESSLGIHTRNACRNSHNPQRSSSARDIVLQPLDRSILLDTSHRPISNA